MAVRLPATLATAPHVGDEFEVVEEDYTVCYRVEEYHGRGRITGQHMLVCFVVMVETDVADKRGDPDPV